MKTSRRLDDTYYAILEKVSVLRQTIGSLQELSGLTKELRLNFESDTKELLEDVEGQVEGFDSFRIQQAQVEGLETRIKAGREKADELTSRIVKAKERVDARAKAEAEWEAQNTRKLIQRTIMKIYTNIVCRPTTYPMEHTRLHHRSHLRPDTLPPI